MSLPIENQRLKDIMFFYAKNNISKFSNDIGISQPRISRLFIKDKRNGTYPKLSFEIVQSVINKFIDVNPEWLLTGSGSMLKSDTQVVVENVGIPYFNVDFTAGFDVLFDSQSAQPDSYVTSPLFADSECVVKCSGDSMAPKIPNGCYIGLKKIDVDDILFGEVYAIVTNNWRTIKYVRKADKSNKLLLVPENKVDYDEQELLKSKVHSVWIVNAYGVRLN